MISWTLITTPDGAAKRSRIYGKNHDTITLTPKVIEKKGNLALIEIEALYPGYGVTVGNALRRVMLSSLEGAGGHSDKYQRRAA